MMTLRAPVNKIIPFSNVDGPSNRTAVFFQGCCFNCLFCHNPETINMCINCGRCVSTCPVKALSLKEGKVVWDPDACVQCDTCIKTCPHDASPRIQWMSVNEVMEQIRRTAPYIEGITTSGGVCTLYSDFLKELFRETRKMGKTCLIDSNGSYDFADDAEMLEVCDGVMLDVKAVEREWNDYLISFNRERILQNLEFLLSAGKLYEVRTLIFPDRDRENEATVRYVSEIIEDKCFYKIIRYRPYGVRERYRRILGEDTTDEVYAQQYVELA
ncbi:MAG: YjjW family glycine radical enzyme activase, partial [Erysipelotrichaceae bacterium]|nr:YjjW family glycine radical enzyme activase [Erysipelotrichaceae bacterium]